jgi:hypothetical protein
LYWFELRRGPNGVSFEPRLIHGDSGVGCVFTVRDVDGDQKPDVFVSNKKGTFLHRQR